MEWSKNHPTRPGIYLLNRGSQIFAMRAYEGGLVKPINHNGKMATLFSNKTISGIWLGPLPEPPTEEVEG